MIQFIGGPLDGETYQEIVRGDVPDDEAPNLFRYQAGVERGMAVEHVYERCSGGYKYRLTEKVRRW